MTNNYEQYKEQNIMNLTKAQQLILLYDEAIKSLNLAKLCIEKNDLYKCNDHFGKFQKINNYLISILNMDYEISDNLMQLYTFCRSHISQANVKKQVSMVDEIIDVYRELRESFDEASKLAH